MSDATTTHLRVAGLDVHAASIRLAVVLRDELEGERTLPFDCQLVERELRRAGVARVCYEAGPQRLRSRPAAARRRPSLRRRRSRARASAQQ